MSDIKQNIVFVDAGLDRDDDERYISSGDAPYRLNIFVSEDGAIGTISNMKGNIQTIDFADHQLNLSNTYVTIGSYYNRLTRKCYYFVFSQPYDWSGSSDYIYDNKLFCYNEDSRTLDLIFTDEKNYFGIELGYPMKDSNMIGDWLYFNPRQSEPKMIDVVRAYNYTNYGVYDTALTYIYGQYVTYFGGLFRATASIAASQTPATATNLWERVGDAYMKDSWLTQYDSEFHYAFNVIHQPPIIRLSREYGTDTNINANNVRGELFRSTYRYKYFDNSYSVYAAYSDVALPLNDELYNGEISNEIYYQNYIRLGGYLHSPALVKEIEVVFQAIDETDWKRAKIINRQEQAIIADSEFEYHFYNNESYEIVTNTTVAKIEDSVPRRANSQEIINKNILSYGGSLEGFDNIPKEDIRVSLIPVLEDITIPPTVGMLKRDNIASSDTGPLTPTGGRLGWQIAIHTWFAAGVPAANDVYSLTIDGYNSTMVLTAEDVTNYTTLTNKIVTFVNIFWDWYSADNRDGHVEIWSPIGVPRMAHITESKFYTPGADIAELTKKKGFKTGANHPFCIFYYDGSLRHWDAQVSKENVKQAGLEYHGTTVYVPMFNELAVLPDTTAHRFVIDWEVGHLPPASAEYWRWGYAGNSLCGSPNSIFAMVQYIISAIADEAPDMVKITIDTLQTLQTTTTADWHQYPNSVISPYTWEKGDRVRFITIASVPGTGTTLGNLIDGVYDFEIIKQDNDTDTIFTQHFDTTGIGENSLIEIYRPLKSVADTKIVYFEFGDIMPIIEDSAGIKVHAGQNGTHNQDTATSASATGTFDGGDIYHILRTPSKPLDGSPATSKGAFHESMWYSDFYNSDDWDRGKIGFETTFGQRWLNIIRYSNQYLQNTQINGLSTFEGTNLKELNDIYGKIIAIYEQGDTLKVYQERKASSILVGRTEYYDTQGNNAVAISDRVFGAIRYSPTQYSTIHPESVSRNNRWLYGFDIINGVMWRDSANGIFPISGRYAEAGGDIDYKMMTYFKEKAKALMISGMAYTNVMSCWDEEFKLLYVTFKDSVNRDNNETIVFHEPSNRWITLAGFDQTPAGGYNTPLELSYDIVRGFAGGIGYEWDEETRFAIFNIATSLGVEDLYPSETFIVDEDGVTFIVDENGTDYIVE